MRSEISSAVWKLGGPIAISCCARMCDFSRRNILLGAAALGGVFEPNARTQSDQASSGNEVNRPIQVADDVYFHQGDIEHQGHCNNGWIVFEDYVLVIDATVSIWFSITRFCGTKIPIEFLPRMERMLHCLKPNRRANFDTSDSRGIKIHTSICICWKWQSRTDSTLMLFNCH